MSRSPIELILDEEYDGNIVLYNENDEEIEFEQIAVVTLDGNVYAILKPVDDDMLADDEALVFCIEEIDDEDVLSIVEDDAIVDEVFEEYYNMLREAGVDVD